MKYLIALCLACCSLSLSANTAKDPLGSVQWSAMEKLYLSDGTVTFDDRVKVLAPPEAENSLLVPVLVDATALSDVQEIKVFADLNPLPLVLRFYPEKALPVIGFDIKVQQATPVRAAVRTGDGVWHVGSALVDAAGGGCTVPSVASGAVSWSSRLGEVTGALYNEPSPGELYQRLRFKVMHPMDTGLAPDIPVFHLTQVNVRDADGQVLARVEPFEPLAENPVFTLEIPPAERVQIAGRDNNGNTFDAVLGVE